MISWNVEKSFFCVVYKVGTGDDGHILKDRKFLQKKSEEIFGGKWTTAEVVSFAALSFVDIKMRI